MNNNLRPLRRKFRRSGDNSAANRSNGGRRRVAVRSLRFKYRWALKGLGSQFADCGKKWKLVVNVVKDTKLTSIIWSTIRFYTFSRSLIPKISFSYGSHDPLKVADARLDKNIIIGLNEPVKKPTRACLLALNIDE